MNLKKNHPEKWIHLRLEKNPAYLKVMKKSRKMNRKIKNSLEIFLKKIRKLEIKKKSGKYQKLKILSEVSEKK